MAELDRLLECAADDKISDLWFQHAYVDSKQKALKVFMNTFYGEASNSLSPFFLLPLAGGGVTTAGQYNIKMVANFITSFGCQIVYGDTDSIYLTLPDELYQEADRDYTYCHIDKEEYWH